MKYACSLAGCDFVAPNPQGKAAHERGHVFRGEAKPPGEDGLLIPTGAPIVRTRRNAIKNSTHKCSLDGCDFSHYSGHGKHGHERGHVQRGEARFVNGQLVSTGLPIAKKNKYGKYIRHTENAVAKIAIANPVSVNTDTVTEKSPALSQFSATDRLKEAIAIISLTEAMNADPAIADQFLQIIASMKLSARKP